MPKRDDSNKIGKVWHIWVAIVTNILKTESLIKTPHPPKHIKRRLLKLYRELNKLFDDLDNEIEEYVNEKIQKYFNRLNKKRLEELRHIFYRRVLTSPMGLREASDKLADPIAFIITLADGFFRNPGWIANLEN